MKKYIERKEPVKAIQLNKYNVAELARMFDEEKLEIYYDDLDDLSATADTIFYGFIEVEDGDYIILTENEEKIYTTLQKDEFEQKYIPFEMEC